VTCWLIGLDDTDVPDSRGTGRLARMVADGLEARGIAGRGVTRHQLWVHPSVPYTSHNSSACVAVDGPVDGAVVDWVCGFVLEQSPQGADPGVCVAPLDAVGASVVDFARRAQRELVRRQDAARLAQESGCQLFGLAGTRDGMIGALAAIGLRADGSDGRFIGLGGIRELADRVKVADLLAAGIDAVRSTGDGIPEPDDWVETLGWTRPRLLGGRAVLLVQRSHEDGVEWIVADRGKRSRGPSSDRR